MNERINRCCVVIFILFSFCSSINGVDSPIVELLADLPLKSQEIPFGERRIYWLKNLQPNSYYEVRVSYPATIPTDFAIEFLNPKKTFSQGRKLLNVEKIMFTTNSDAHDRDIISVQDKEGFFVLVTPTNAGVAVSSKAVFDHVVFDITLESLFYNIPYPIFKIVALMIVAVLVIIFAAIPKTLEYFEKLKQEEKFE